MSASRRTPRRALPWAVLAAVLLVAALAGPAAAQTGVRFDGSNDYVTFGQAPTLGLGTFTLECWVRRDGAGVAASTGTGGVTAVPLIAKGRGEADGDNRDCNYFLGIRGTDSVLVADFEEGAGQPSPGLNHPVAGVTGLARNRWYHVAATYDGSRWQLFLDGNLETELVVGRAPQAASIQHASLGTALTSAGAAAGFLAGVLDEVRIWNHARTQAEIQAAMVQQVTSGTGLVGRWGLDDGSGAAAANSVAGGVTGTLTNGPVWEGGSPFSHTAQSLQWSGTNAAVSFGVAPALGLQTFTLECWLRRDAAGVATSTGAGGVTAVPLITKGRAESDGSNLDMNYFLGIDGTSGVLTADFEEGAGQPSPGLNHPILGVTPLADHTWYHAAVTFDGAKWQLFLNGDLERELTVGALPQSASIQHAGLATAFTSTGAAAGYFAGVLDEVRIWSYARSGEQIRADLNAQITAPQTGLVGRWALDEGAGNTVNGSAGTSVNGIITGANWGWWAAAPFDIAPPPPPSAPSGLVATAPAASYVHLTWTDNAVTETAQVIERSTTGAGGPFADLDTVAANVQQYDDLTVAAAAEYCYRVRAYNAQGASAPSDPACAVTPAETHAALDFAGGQVSFGVAPALGLGSFTIECWFRRDGAGVTTTTGTGGITDAIPLVTKGRGEAEASNVDMNWFLGIRAADGVLCADFEEGAAGASPGLNHPVTGITPVGTGVWHHAAATYDGTTWQLYLDGALEGQVTVGRPPQSASIQHAGLATAFTSTGAAAGSFDGALDEVRVWSYARTQGEILAAANLEITAPQTGLVARWGLDEAAGTAVHGSAGTAVEGTLQGGAYTWIQPGAPFNVAPPAPPAAPTNLTATSTSADRVELAWTDASATELGFMIERSQGGGPFAVVDSVGVNVQSFSDATVAPVTSYAYRVLAYNQAGVSEPSALAFVTTPATVNCGLDFAAADARVSFGAAPALGLATFTVECWFRRDGAGTAASTGSGGVNAVPLVTKGRGEADGSNVDMNWFLGIDAASGVLTADFEEGAAGTTPGLNHPVSGVTPIAVGGWHHAAVTYDGTRWQLYLDGALESELVVGQPPQAASIQHAGLATAFTSTGVAAGSFDGALDEVRVWSYARSAAELRSWINEAIASPQPGLVARWGLNECTGTAVLGSAGTAVDGTIAGTSWSWSGGSPFDLLIDLPPDAPVLAGPANGAAGTASDPLLRVQVNDPEGQDVTVSWYGRPKPGPSGASNFTLIGIPDTQYYSAGLNGGSGAIYNAQMQWMVANRVLRNIVYAAQLGDCVESGDNNGNPAQWIVADAAWDHVEDPVTTGLVEGIPFGIAVGNHDQSPNGDAAGTTTFYNQYFGEARFGGRAYYGGHFGANNDNHFDLFSAGGLDFLVLFMEYDTAPDQAVLDWADSLLAANASRRAIVVSHSLMGSGEQGAFSSQGSAVYNALKDRPNLFLMLCGHVPGEGKRQDVFEGRTVYTLMSDYQSRANGGDGWLRILEFSPTTNEILVKTYSPTLDQFETDASSQFTLPYTMTPDTPFELLGTAVGAGPGETAELPWPGRAPLGEYEWYVTVSDGHTTVTSPVWGFAVADTARLTVLVEGAGAVQRQPDRDLQDLGHVVELMAVPDPGYAFAGWSGDASGTENPLALLMDGPKTVTATFAPATDVGGAAIAELRLAPPSPSPATGGANLVFDLPRPARVRLQVLDVRGRVMGVLADGPLPAGRHVRRWGGPGAAARVPAGVYFVELTAEGRRLVQRGVHLR